MLSNDEEDAFNLAHILQNPIQSRLDDLLFCLNTTPIVRPDLFNGLVDPDGQFQRFIFVCMPIGSRSVSAAPE